MRAVASGRRVPNTGGVGSLCPCDRAPATVELLPAESAWQVAVFLNFWVFLDMRDAGAQICYYVFVLFAEGDIWTEEG